MPFSDDTRMPVPRGSRIRLEEAARRLHVQPNELENLVENGKLNASHSGQLFFVDINEAWDLLVAVGRIRYRTAVTA